MRSPDPPNDLGGFVTMHHRLPSHADAKTIPATEESISNIPDPVDTCHGIRSIWML